MQKKKLIIIFCSILATIILWQFIISVITPTEMVAMLGVSNSFIIVFFVSLFGSASALTTASFYAAIIAFAAGGLNPLLLGIIGGIGATIGDLLFYVLGRAGRAIAPPKAKSTLDRFAHWLQKQPLYRIWLVIFLYVGLAPFPNDFLVVTLAIGRYSLTRIFIPLLAGNITLIMVLAFLATHGIEVFG